jgi:hypothetical protein
MKFRSLDKNGDWNFGKGLQDFATEDAAIALNVKTRLLSWVGDCFFDLPAGIDWWNRLGSKNQRDLLELDLRRVIMQSKDVTGIVKFTTTVEGRNFSAQYEITTIYSKSFIDSLTLEG